jgi:hypothetical protein
VIVGTESGVASANNAVKDLRPLRGSLSLVLDRIVCCGWNLSYGSVPLPVSRRNQSFTRAQKHVLV